MEWVKQQTDELAGAAQQLPAKLLGLAATAQPGGRDTGLLVTRGDIFKIKRYERLGLSLPTTTGQVEAALGYGTSYVGGFEPADFVILYSIIHEHAVGWSGIEQQVKLVNTKLGSFASDFLTSGERLVKYVDAMDWLDPFETSISDLKPEDIAGLLPELLSEGDLKTKNNLQVILQRMRRSITEQKNAVEDVRAKISVFAEVLSQQLLPRVNRKIHLGRRHRLTDSIATLDEEIVRLADEIKVKREEYDQLVKSILIGLVFGLVGGLIMVNIFGEDAERVRQERNSLIEERDRKIQESKSKAPLIEAVSSLVGYLEHIEITMTDALAGAQNLRSVWDVLHAWVDNSENKLKAITDQSSMAEFALEFKLVLEPWKQIKEQSNTLAATFNRAINDWNSGVKI